MNTYPHPAIPAAVSFDEDADMPLIIRVVTSGPNLGRRTVIEAEFTPAAFCEGECDRAFNRIPVEQRPVPPYDTSAYQIYRFQMREREKRGVA